mmetsp:Transcript_8598/g.13206  ORF Transcript_8598/g.13206 Transcript_8598/m.13206 type:complete len:446 (+) Transcript_8598:7-1344(+)
MTNEQREEKMLLCGSSRENDALCYIEDVKKRFAERPIIYYKFLDLLKEFRSQKKDTLMILQEVSTLFSNHTDLLLGFNSFLPFGYKIIVREDDRGKKSSSIIIPNVELVELDDPRVEVYRCVKERDLAGARKDYFLLEGENSISNLVRYGRIPLVSICISEKRIAPMQKLIRAVAAKGIPIYALPQTSLEALVGFNFHRGVLGCGRKLPAMHPDSFMKQQLYINTALHHQNYNAGPIILCEKINNLDNIGALFRNAACFGARAILFDDQCSDPYYRKSLRVSGGHALAIPFNHKGSIQNILQAVKDQGFYIIALVTPHTPCQPQSIIDWRPPSSHISYHNATQDTNNPLKIALLLGAEGPGLSKSAQALADARLTIPMAPDVDSLNVATTAAVALHEITTKFTRSTSLLDRPKNLKRGGFLISLLSLTAATTVLSSSFFFLLLRR